jgi:hypothetical protein
MFRVKVGPCHNEKACHKWRDCMEHDGNAIYIEDYISPNVNLKVGDVCYFVCDDHKNDLILTISPKGYDYKYPLKPIDGFQKVEPGKYKLSVNDMTPKAFFYWLNHKNTLGGNVFVRN